MKITKEYLRTIIKEELGRLEELDTSPAIQKAREEMASSTYDGLTSAELKQAPDKEDEIRNLLSKDKNITAQQIADLENAKGFNSQNQLAKKMGNSLKIKQPAPAGSDEKRFRDALRSIASNN